MKRKNSLRRLISIAVMLCFSASLFSVAIAQKGKKSASTSAKFNASKLTAEQKLSRAKKARKESYTIKNSIQSRMKKAIAQNNFVAVDALREQFTSIKALLNLIETNMIKLKDAIAADPSPGNTKAVAAYVAIMKFREKCAKFEVLTSDVPGAPDTIAGTGGPTQVIQPPGASSADPTAAVQDSFSNDMTVGTGTDASNSF